MWAVKVIRTATMELARLLNCVISNLWFAAPTHRSQITITPEKKLACAVHLTFVFCDPFLKRDLLFSVDKRQRIKKAWHLPSSISFFSETQPKLSVIWQERLPTALSVPRQRHPGSPFSRSVVSPLLYKTPLALSSQPHYTRHKAQTT